MASPDLTAAQVMNASGALLNDVALSIYTYIYQIPYLNIALRELQEHYELNNIPVTEQSSAAIAVDASVILLDYTTVPPLPSTLIEPITLWERARGVNPYIPMTKRKFLPHSLEGITISQLQWWVWQHQSLNFLPADQNNDIKIDGIFSIFTTVTASTDQLNIVNGISFLQYRTAALCAEFIGENKTRADSLNVDAGLAIDRVTSIGTKGKQAIITRRRPFRAGFKSRGY